MSILSEVKHLMDNQKFRYDLELRAENTVSWVSLVAQAPKSDYFAGEIFSVDSVADFSDYRDAGYQFFFCWEDLDTQKHYLPLTLEQADTVLTALVFRSQCGY